MKTLNKRLSHDVILGGNRHEYCIESDQSLVNNGVVRLFGNYWCNSVCKWLLWTVSVAVATVAFVMLESVPAAAAGQSAIQQHQVENWFMKGNKELENQNYVEAEKWFRKAAEQGHAGAQNNLGLMYRNNKGDLVEAMKWLRLAADQGHAGAQCNLALCYAAQENYEMTFRYAKMSAEQGEAMGQYVLGLLYVTGTPATERNVAEGKRWLEKAAAQGNEDARQLLMRL